MIRPYTSFLVAHMTRLGVSGTQFAGILMMLQMVKTFNCYANGLNSHRL